VTWDVNVTDTVAQSYLIVTSGSSDALDSRRVYGSSFRATNGNGNRNSIFYISEK